MAEWLTGVDVAVWWHMPGQALVLVVAFSLGFMTIGTLK